MYNKIMLNKVHLRVQVTRATIGKISSRKLTMNSRAILLVSFETVRYERSAKTGIQSSPVKRRSKRVSIL